MNVNQHMTLEAAHTMAEAAHKMVNAQQDIMRESARAHAELSKQCSESQAAYARAEMDKADLRTQIQCLDETIIDLITPKRHR